MGRLSDRFDAQSDGWTAGMYPRGEEDDGDCPSLMFCGPSDGGPWPGIHTAGTFRVSMQRARDGLFIRRAPAGASYSGPKSGFHTAGHDRALSRRAPTGPSIGVARPSPQSAGPGRSFMHGTWLGFLFGGTSASTPRLNFHSADSGRALSRRVPARLSKSGPRRDLSRLSPARLSYSGPQSPVPQSV